MQLELTFGNDQVHLPSVRAFLQATLRELPLQSDTVEKLGAFIEIAVLDAISTAYPQGVQGLIKLKIQEQHGLLEIRVRDFGIPKDVQLMEWQLLSSESIATAGFQSFADEIHWLTFGPEGKALQLKKWLHETRVAEATGCWGNRVAVCGSAAGTGAAIHDPADESWRVGAGFAAHVSYLRQHLFQRGCLLSRSSRRAERTWCRVVVRCRRRKGWSCRPLFT